MQANARCDRLGQKHPVSIYMLFASTVEREIYKNLQTQGAQQEGMLQIFNSLIGL
jgi:SNF2 family DNA or RNA helicase